MKKKIVFSSIKWDTDSRNVSLLPNNVELEVGIDLDVDLEGADALSDKYGYCVKSFSWESMPDAETSVAAPHATRVVEYESVWDEGSVTTQAILNLRTGEITDIETSDHGEDYEHLQYEEIRDVSRGISAIVVSNNDGQYFLEDMEMLTQFGGGELRSKPEQPRG
jgi:hypothetical protein